MRTVAWPRLMCAATAAQYVDERSAETFRKQVGSLYPKPRFVRRGRSLWLKDDLDKAIDEMCGARGLPIDAAEVL